MTAARSRRLRYARRHLQLFSWGAGPAILLVHGWGANAAQMSPLVAPLVEDGHEVVAFDAPAHGASDGWLTDPIEFTRSIRAVADAVGPLAGMIGHSFGAAAAMLAIRDWSVHTDSLVLLSSYADFDCIAAHLRDTFGASERVLDGVCRKLFAQYEDRLRRADFSPAEVLRSINCPTLIVHDQDDATVPVVHAQQLLDAARSGLLLETKGYGHDAILNPTVARHCAAFVAARRPLSTRAWRAAASMAASATCDSA